jgi:hypothetical protein
VPECNIRATAGSGPGAALCLPRISFFLKTLTLAAFRGEGPTMRSVGVSLLWTIRISLRDRAAPHLEILALRHQPFVVNRSRPQRLPLTQADRMLWVWLLRVWDGWRGAIVIVKPETVLAWL